ncbi:MAG TPA: PIG-L family deacetylase [bacterium]|nr:PIG-L family deacetylase [bacterium]
MRILAIHAHPDDIEYFAAGTLYMLKQNGHEIFIATMTAGDKGSKAMDPIQTANIRREEAARAARVIGAEYACLEFGDYEVFDTDNARRKTTEHIRRVAPDILLTAPPTDYHADDEAASRLTRYASFAVGLPNYVTGRAPCLDQVPALYYMDPAGGVDLFGNRVDPDFVVNVTSAMEIKKDMLACHESQRDWLRSYHGVDNFLEDLVEWSRSRGETYGVPFAEGFKQHKGFAYPQENLLAQCLPSEVMVMVYPKA